MAAALVQPINLVARVVGFDRASRYPYSELEVKVGDVPVSSVLDDLKDHFSSFIEKYVADSFTRTELLEELAEYISACESGGTHTGSKSIKMLLGRHAQRGGALSRRRRGARDAGAARGPVRPLAPRGRRRPAELAPVTVSRTTVRVLMNEYPILPTAVVWYDD